MSTELKHSKNRYIPLYVLGFAMGLVLISMFTPYEIDETHITILEYVLTPIGLAGIAKHGFDVYQKVKLKTP